MGAGVGLGEVVDVGVGLGAVVGVGAGPGEGLVTVEGVGEGAVVGVGVGEGLVTDGVGVGDGDNGVVVVVVRQVTSPGAVAFQALRSEKDASTGKGPDGVPEWALHAALALWHAAHLASQSTSLPCQ